MICSRLELGCQSLLPWSPQPSRNIPEQSAEGPRLGPGKCGCLPPCQACVCWGWGLSLAQSTRQPAWPSLTSARCSVTLTLAFCFFR